MVFKRNDPATQEAGRKGAASRKQPYYHFAELKKQDPKALRKIQRRGGKVSQS